MFPLRDSIPSERRPIVNVLIILACTIAFMLRRSGLVAARSRQRLF
jgi:hypothetical protein